MKMSNKQTKRKITVNITTKSKASVPTKQRPSVFERLGTKATSSNLTTTTTKDYCHHWSQNGTCPYGKSCKYSSTHTLISPSKRAAKSVETAVKRQPKDAHSKRAPNPDEDWDRWDPDELADADPDDLEKRRQELQRELELQMKMENKARRKEKKIKKESSPSTDSSSTSSESSSSSDDSSTSSSSSTDTRRKKTKKTKAKRDSSSSSDEKHKHKIKTRKIIAKPISNRTEKNKKIIVNKSVVKTITKSPSPVRIRKQSQTPPLKIKPKTSSIESKSPRPTSRSSKEKHRTPSPKPPSRDKEREKEREREKEKERLKLKEREQRLHRSQKASRSPKREARTKRRESPDSVHSRDRKSPPRSRTSSTRRDTHKDDRRNDKEKDRPRPKERPRERSKERRDSRERERERERERRLAREEREAAREKEREEALARCQERQRERERLKELAKKEEERSRRERNRREDRGLDKPTGDRVERLLPLPEDRVPPGRKGHSAERDRRERRERSPRKADERHDVEKERGYERGYERTTDRSAGSSYDVHDREYGGRLREVDSPYERTARHEDRMYMEIDDHYGDNARMEVRDYPADERRSRRDLWEATRDDREIDREPEQHGPRYNRDDSRPPTALKVRAEWDPEYSEHEWDTRSARRAVDWDTRDGWGESTIDHKLGAEDEWRHYSRSMDSWTNEERRRWPVDWRERDRSRPRSSTSYHKDDETASESRRKEPPPPARSSDHVESKPPPPPLPEAETKKELPPKRPAEPLGDPPPIEVKKPHLENPLEDDLSEISDDADEILNRDEEMPPEETTPTTVVAPPPQQPTQEITEGISERPASPNSQHQPPSPKEAPKENSIDEENMDLDFEEISEDELEEESRVKGIGDALGVDWASLVAESRPRSEPVNSAKRRWESHNVLASLGLSVELAGEKLVEDITKDGNSKENGESGKELEISHPAAVIQVVDRNRQAVRKVLFSSVGPNRRALSARRDLMIRRHLCNLPLKDSYVEAPKRYDPELFKLATKLFERCL